MNKVVMILGIIVLITLGGLFFCAGFFTGTTMSPVQNLQTKKDNNSDKEVSVKDVEPLINTKSETISEKIMSILASAADTATSSISSVMEKKNSPITEESSVSVDSLLREIVANHATTDDCSTDKTMQKMNTPTHIDHNTSLYGKRIVFVGYFRNNIAFEIQKLLTGKGYKAHVEPSRAANNESFIFCGPFKKDKNAKKLIQWLRKHDFTEARMISVSNNAIEETLYDTIHDDDSGMPKNAENDTHD